MTNGCHHQMHRLSKTCDQPLYSWFSSGFRKEVHNICAYNKGKLLLCAKQAADSSTRTKNQGLCVCTKPSHCLINAVPNTWNPSPVGQV